jgi:hypothetical protein
VYVTIVSDTRQETFQALYLTQVNYKRLFSCILFCRVIGTLDVIDSDHNLIQRRYMMKKGNMVSEVLVAPLSHFQILSQDRIIQLVQRSKFFSVNEVKLEVP